MNNKKKPFNRPTDSTQKKKSKEVITCPVCEDSIADPSNKCDGDDSVFVKALVMSGSIADLLGYPHKL